MPQPAARAREIAPAKGKLGVLLVGLGAVSTTFIAGVENVRRGRGLPIGSLTQMSTIRLGKRFDLLAAGPELRAALEAGQPARAIWERWAASLAAFRATRAKYLLY